MTEHVVKVIRAEGAKVRLVPIITVEVAAKEFIVKRHHTEFTRTCQ